MKGSHNHSYIDRYLPVLRLLAEGRIGWSFWPSETDEAVIVEENGDDNGIWIPRFSVVDEDNDEGEDEQEPLEEEGSECTESEEGSSEEDTFQSMGRFNALLIDEDSEEDEEIVD